MEQRKTESRHNSERFEQKSSNRGAGNNRWSNDSGMVMNYGYFTIRVANIIGNYLVKFMNTSGVPFTT